MNIASIVSMPTIIPLVCSKCGAQGEGSCRCGAPYIAPGQRAAAALKAEPGKSDRAIAAEAGVGSNTVRRAREPAAPHGAPEKRQGRDGKHYPAKTKRAKRKSVARLPLNMQVNKILDQLSNDVHDDCRAIFDFLDTHPELEQEGRDAFIQFLQMGANKLLDLAQMIDGRSTWQNVFL